MGDRLSSARNRMVDDQVRRRGIRDAGVLRAMRAVPRHLFVPATSRDAAYSDTPLRIGHGQTISQPYIVALMTGALELQGSERALEVGTGSGYQAAILSRLVRELHTIEIVAALAKRAARLLARLGCRNVTVHVGDGSLGWPPAAPYDAMVVAAAAPAVPVPLIQQLADGGRLIVPVASADGYQLLTLVRNQAGRVTEHALASVAFVPLHGQFGVKS